MSAALRFAVVLATAYGGPAPLAADLDEARRLIKADRPEAALEITDAALAENPHDPTAHALRLRALYARGRAREAVPALDAWAAEAPEDSRPLRVLVGAYSMLNDGEGLASIPLRAKALPDDARRELLRAVVSTQLTLGRFADAAVALETTPAPVSDEPEDRLFRALDAARRGDLDALFPLLDAHPELYDAVGGEAAWWITRLLDGAPPAPVSAGKPEGAVGGVVTSGADVPVFPRGDVVLPEIVRKVPPIFPAAAREKAISGKVTTQAVILASGVPAAVTVLASTNPIFNDAARRAILRWRYKPAMQNAKPVSIYFTIVIQFKLQ